MVQTRSQSRTQQNRYQQAEQALHQWWIRELNAPNRRQFARRTWPRNYRQSDLSKRHRIKDTQPKTERVTSYTRRI